MARKEQNIQEHGSAGNYPMYPACKVVKGINVEMVEMIMSYFEEQNGATICVEEPKQIIIR